MNLLCKHVLCTKCLKLKLCRFKEIKIFKEKFLKSDIVKRNHENMKSNDGIPSNRGKENEGTCFRFR